MARPNVLTIGTVATTLGERLVAVSEAGVAALWPTADQAGLVAQLVQRFPAHASRWTDADPRLAALARWLASWPETDADAPALDLRGLAPFAAAVYRVVQAIPRGETRTYGEVALLAGRPGAARAVGNAMARCPLFPLVPCHRVVRAADGWSGWGGDDAPKRRLQRVEAATSCSSPRPRRPMPRPRPRASSRRPPGPC